MPLHSQILLCRLSSEAEAIECQVLQPYCSLSNSSSHPSVHGSLRQCRRLGISFEELSASSVRTMHQVSRQRSMTLTPVEIAEHILEITGFDY